MAAASAEPGEPGARGFEAVLQSCEGLLNELREAHAREISASVASTSAVATSPQVLALAAADQERFVVSLDDSCSPRQREPISEQGQPNKRLTTKDRARLSGMDVTALDISAIKDAKQQKGSAEDVVVLNGKSEPRHLGVSSLLATSKNVNNFAEDRPFRRQTSPVPASPLTGHSHSEFSNRSSTEVRNFAMRSTWRSFQGGETEIPQTPGRFVRSKTRVFSESEVKPIKNKRSRNWRGQLWAWLLGILLCWRGRKTFIMSPDTAVRLGWDLMGTALIGWDLIVIPLSALEIPPSLFTDVVGWFITLFWTLDIGASFCVGFYLKGNLIMEPRRVAWHYVTSWFGLDCIIVGGDWFTKVGADDLDVLGVGRITRIIRTVRVLRLLRLFKLKRLLAELQEHIYTEYSFILATVVKQLLFILVMNHGVACTWYWIGTKSDESDGWVDFHITWAGSDTSIGYKYCTAIHWSLTQFMPGSMEVNPRNLYERLFAILVLLMGMIGFSSFVSNITTSMTSLRNLTSEDGKQLWLLRRFMQQQGVPKTLSLKTCSFLEYTLSERRNRVPASDIKLFAYLSEPLKDELNYQLRVKHLERHPLFAILCDNVHVPSVLMHRLCRTAVTNHSLAAGDILFCEADEADHMYCFISGELEYEYTPYDNDIIEQVDIKRGDYICEAALWAAWRHVGELRAGPRETSLSELLFVEAKAFGNIVGRHPNAWSLASSYAGGFLSELNAAEHSTGKVASDMFTAQSRVFLESHSEELVEQDWSDRQPPSRTCLGLGMLFGGGRS